MDPSLRVSPVIDSDVRPATGLGHLWRQSLSYLGPYRRQNSLVVVALVVDTAFRLTFFYYMKVLIDDAVGGRSARGIVPILIGLAVFFVVASLADVGRDYLSADVDVRLGNDLRLALLRHVHRLSVDFYGRAQLGDLLTRFSADVATIKAALTRALPSVVHRTIQIAGCLIFLLALDWRLTLVTVIVLCVSLVVSRSLVTRSLRADYDDARADAGIVSEIQEQLSGQAVIRAFGLAPLMEHGLERRLEKTQQTGVKASRLSRLVRSTSAMGITFTTSTVTALGVVLVFHHALSVGSLVGFVGVLNLLGQAAFRLSESFPGWLNASSAFQRVTEILDERPTVEDNLGAFALTGVAREIRFDRVTFGYGDSANAVHDLSFSIAAGQSVAFVGRSGAGKSTVLSLLLRLHDPNMGAITVDDHDIRSLTLSSFRELSGVVFQEAFLFDRSIRENIRVGRPEASDGEVEAAARAAQVHDAILELTEGYDTAVGERGGRLSGGQRQRIALARALVREPAILVLDEATSALDPATESSFNETLREISRTRTVISATHRLAAASLADRIIVFESGRIAEQGSHHELIEMNGIYRRLWDQQTGFVISADGRSAVVTPERLRQIPFFASAVDEALAALAKQFTPRNYEPGEDVIRQGEVAHSFFILVRGSLKVLLTGEDGRERQIDAREEGEFFGEIGLLHDVRRTATVRASLPSLVLTLTRLQFEELMSTFPDLRTLVERRAAERSRRVQAGLAAEIDEADWTAAGVQA